MPRSLRCPIDGSSSSLVVLTNMQWFYGPVWGRTVRTCDHLPPSRQRDGCTTAPELHARQLELVEVLRRNVIHPAVGQVRVLVGEVAPLRRFLGRLPWYTRLGCKVQLIQTGSRPRFSDYMRQLSGPLRGQTVAFTNQDVFLAADTDWAAVPRALGPRQAFFLSRYHQREQYDVQHSLAASAAEGVFNLSLPAASGSGRVDGRTDTWRLPAVTQHRATTRTCDMTARRFALWSRSLCTPANFGSYDAYVLRIDRELSSAELDLFDYPQNAWGGENLFLFLIQQALGIAASNPCLSLRAVHMHCELATSFGVQKVGERRLGKREIIDRALSKLRAVGNHAADFSHQDIGRLTLNVTRLNSTRSLQGSAGQKGSRAAGQHSLQRAAGRERTERVFGHRGRSVERRPSN